MLDKLLDIGCMFDWITPVAAEIQDRAHGSPHTFFIPDDCGVSGGQVKRALRSRGIQTWGHMIVNHAIMITVPEADAQRAQQILAEERIPVEYGQTDPQQEAS